MISPQGIPCSKGGDCCFVFSYKKKAWKCRRCKTELPLEQPELTDTLLKELSSHTKGAWFVDPIGYRSSIQSEDGKHVASVNFMNKGSGEVNVVGREHDSNTFLIAIAPLLLEEVKRLRKGLKTGEPKLSSRVKKRVQKPERPRIKRKKV